MDAECHEVAARANWKLSTLLRARRFYNTPALVNFYKSQVLPTLEFPTAAIYHCTDTALSLLDRVQKRFLRAVGLTEKEALLQYNLGPLQTRRDVALLGVIHRALLGEGPVHFQRWFFKATGEGHSYETRLKTGRHSKQLFDYLTGDHTELLRRSPLGLTKVYNQLPQRAVDKHTVKAFQKWLQKEVKSFFFFLQPV